MGTGQNPHPDKTPLQQTPLPLAKTPLLQKSPSGQNPLRQKVSSGKKDLVIILSSP